MLFGLGMLLVAGMLQAAAPKVAAVRWAKKQPKEKIEVTELTAAFDNSEMEQLEVIGAMPILERASSRYDHLTRHLNSK